MSETVLVERDGPVATLVLNAPERRNPLSRDTMLALIERLKNVGEDQTLRAVVLGANGPVFSAGHDLREMRDRDEAFYDELFQICSRLMLTVHGIRQPVIARVQASIERSGEEAERDAIDIVRQFSREAGARIDARLARIGENRDVRVRRIAAGSIP